jgi:hypothetical protein
MAATRAGARRPVVPDPMIFAPSGETWKSVRALYEAGSLAKVSVARLAGMSAPALRERARRGGWRGAPGSGGAPKSVAAVAPPPAGPAAALPGSLRDPTLPQGEGGCTRPTLSQGEGGRPNPGVESAALSAKPLISPPPSAPDPRTQSGRAALVDQLYGLFAAQLSAAGADGLGGALEQRMRSLATFAKTLDALVDLDQRLGGRDETGEADFDAYRAELARCLAGLVGGRGEGG